MHVLHLLWLLNMLSSTSLLPWLHMLLLLHSRL